MGHEQGGGAASPGTQLSREKGGFDSNLFCSSQCRWICKSGLKSLHIISELLRTYLNQRRRKQKPSVSCTCMIKSVPRAAQRLFLFNLLKE